jgi:clan AA aspartic protease (TIGR02281 family)
MARLRTALLSLSLLSMTSTALAAAKPDACVYVELAKLPIKYAGAGLAPTIPGTVNGKPARMLADTGADILAMTRGFADKLGAKLEATDGRLVGVGGITSVYRAQIEEMTVGPTRAGRTAMPVIGATGVEPSFDVIVGAPFLMQADLEIALGNRELTFYRPQDCKDSFLGDRTGGDVSVIPYSWRWGRGPNPYFTIEVNGQEIVAMIDTGASSTLIELRAAKRLGLKLDAPGVVKLDDITGIGAHTAPHWSARFDTLAIGDEIIKNVRIGVMETPTKHDFDMLLGRDFLRQHRVLFARSQKKLYISYTGSGDEVFVSHATRIEPWLQREADEGNPDAEIALAGAYASGKLVKKDVAAANRWFERAADHGHPRAQLALGRRLMLQGRDAAAAARLRAALDHYPDNGQVALWLYITRLRAHQAALGQQELAAAFRSIKAWPAPVAELYLGHLDAAALFAQAAQDAAATPADSRHRVCHSAASVADLLAAQGKQAESNAVIAAHADCRLNQRPVLAAAGSVPPALAITADITADIADDATDAAAPDQVQR